MMRYFYGILVVVLVAAASATTALAASANPTYQTGFARSADQSERPQDWRQLVGWWLPSLGPTGDTLRDLTAFQHHGTLTSMPAAWVRDQGRLALEFDGSADYVDLKSPIFDPTDSQMSFMLWLNTDVVNGEDTLLGARNNAANTGFEFRYNGLAAGDPLQFTMFGVVGQDSDASGIAANTWRHVAVSYDKKNIIFYVDGQVLSSHAQTGAYKSTTGQSVFIGALNESTTPTHHFNGTLDDVRVYHRALSAVEIAEIYRDSGGSSRYERQTLGTIIAEAVAAGGQAQKSFAFWW